MRVPTLRLRTLLILVLLGVFLAGVVAYLGRARWIASQPRLAVPDQRGESPAPRAAAIVESGLPTDGGVLIPLDERRGFAAASFSPDGADLAVAWVAQPGITTYDAHHGGVRSVLPCDGYPESVTYTPGGDLLVVGRQDKPAFSGTTSDRHAYVRLIDARDGHLKATLLRGIQPGRLVDLSPDGRWVAATVPDAIFVWDLAEDHEAARLPYRRTGMDSLLAFSPDGRTLAVADGRVGEKSLLVLWDIKRGEARPLARPEEPHRHYGPAISDFAFSPDGTRLAGAIENVTSIPGRSGIVVTVVIWDVATARIVARSDELKGPGGDMRGYRLRCTPDGRWLFSTYRSRVSRHDPRTGAVVDSRDPAYVERGRLIHVLAFSRDGGRLATISYGPYQGDKDELFIGEIGRLFDSPHR